MRPLERGFTLVELMLVVAVVGLLSSIAIPSFARMQLRSRQAERSIMVETIRKSIDDYHMRSAAFPQDLGGGWSFLNLSHNPDATQPKTYKRPFRQTRVAGDHWTDLTLRVEGGVYYRYNASGFAWPRVRWYWVNVAGDLDGDGQVNELQRDYYYADNVLQNWGLTVDSKCSRELDLSTRADAL